jgi:hypothetical protein
VPAVGAQDDRVGGADEAQVDLGRPRTIADLQSLDGWILAGGIVTCNCRCTVRYVTGAFVDKPLAQFDDKGNLIP